MLTLGQAAKLAGVSKTTLARGIKFGRLSATRLDGGGYAIDPSELASIYNVTPEAGAATVETVRSATPATRLALADAELRAFRDMLAEVRQSRDAWQAQAERLALMAPTVIAAPGPAVTPAPVATPVEPEPRRSWLRWWFSLKTAG
jgi:excisionase family DNA binding protein